MADAEVLALGRWSTGSEEFEHAVTASNASVAAVKPRVGYNVRPSEQCSHEVTTSLEDSLVSAVQGLKELQET